MFKVLEPGARKRRIWSAGTVTASLAAHILVLGGIASASMGPPAPAAEVVRPLIDIPVPEAPVKVHPQPEQPAHPDASPAPRGRTVELPAPVDVPTKLPPIDPGAKPLTPEMTTGQGPVGVVHGDPLAGQRPGGDPTVSEGGAPTGVVRAEDLGEIPALANAAEVRRILQRTYPPMLRDAGVQGEARLQFVVNTDGRVDPATVTVVGATQPAFADAARRAVERFRFKPASMMGEPVRVLITLPIHFTLEGQ
ncbi:MAG: hypothetical protein JWM27_3597 [Gemmatimonadetes bacterium]|nr:hypothetical protein [Gemmatimonadota bacterium]